MKKKQNLPHKSRIKEISKLESLEDIFVISENLPETDKKKLLSKIKKDKSNKEIISKLNKAKTIIELREYLAESLKEDMEKKYAELKDITTQKRKKGSDTLIAELKLMSMQYKMKLFSATKSKKDYLKLKHIALEIKKLI